MTWYEALSECRNQSMELVSITDQYQLAFITVTVSQVGQPMWIGLSSRDVSFGVFFFYLYVFFFIT